MRQGQVVAANEQPITRSELREELRHYATKADLANLKADLTWRMMVMMFGAAAAAAAAVSTIDRLLG